MTASKSVEYALAFLEEALERELVHPRPGAHSHLVAAHVQALAAQRLLAGTV